MLIHLSLICCTKLVVRDCPKCDIGDITNRDNPASSSTNTTKPTTATTSNTTSRDSILRVREEELSKRQQDMKEKEERLKRQESKLEKEKREMDDKIIRIEQENNNKQKATTTATSSSSSSDITEVTNMKYPDGLFTGLVKGSQRYKGTLVYHANNAKERKEYTGDFVNGTSTTSNN